MVESTDNRSQLVSLDGNSRYFEEDLTNRTLKQYAECIKKYAELRGLVSGFTGQGRTIKCLHDLILCYYAGIRIICIPHKDSPPSLVLSQYYVLVTKIHEAVKQIVQEKREAEILLNSEDLDVYFEHAFHHFSNNPLKQFNFLNAVFYRNPIQGAFKANYISTAVDPNPQEQDNTGKVPQLATLLASGILLDVRHKGYPQTREFLRVCHERLLN